MKIQYQFLSEHNLLIEKYIGNFTLAHYFAYYKKILSLPEWKNIHRLLVDLRYANLDIAFENIEKLIDFRKKVIKKEYLGVFLVDKPFSTAATHLYQETLTHEKYEYAYCTTLKKAIAILQLDNLGKKIEFHLNNPKNQF